MPKFDKNNLICFNDAGELMEEKIIIKGGAFIFYHRKDSKFVEGIEFKEGGEITIFSDEKGCCLHQTFIDFPPDKIMFGCTSRGKEEPCESFLMKIKLGDKEVKISTLTIVAGKDNISVSIS